MLSYMHYHCKYPVAKKIMPDSKWKKDYQDRWQGSMETWNLLIKI